MTFSFSQTPCTVRTFQKVVEPNGMSCITLKDIALLNWLNLNCPKIPFIYKCDDDVYVNAHNLSAILKAMPRNEETSYGTKNWNHLFVQRGSGS